MPCWLSFVTEPPVIIIIFFVVSLGVVVYVWQEALLLLIHTSWYMHSLLVHTPVLICWGTDMLESCFAVREFCVYKVYMVLFVFQGIMFFGVFVMLIMSFCLLTHVHWKYCTVLLLPWHTTTMSLDSPQAILTFLPLFLLDVALKYEV